jgi:hypothetical protein
MKMLTSNKNKKKQATTQSKKAGQMPVKGRTQTRKRQGK